MKTLHKTLLIGLVCSLPMSLMAHDRGGHDGFGDHFSSMFDDDREHCGSSKLLSEKGANYIFEGKVENMPKDALSGQWKISGKDVTVNDETVIYQLDELFKVGDEVFIIAKREGKKIVAIELSNER